MPRLCHWGFLRPEELRGVIPLLTLLEAGAWSRSLLTCPEARVVLRQTKPTNSCVAAWFARPHLWLHGAVTAALCRKHNCCPAWGAALLLS